MAGISVQCAGQDVRRDARHVVLLEPGGYVGKQLLIRQPVALSHHVFVERSEDHQNFVSPPAEILNETPKGTPLQRACWVDPFEVSRAEGICGPRFVAWTLRAALRVVPRLGGN